MAKKKEVGEFHPYEYIESILTKDFYGTVDLLHMNLFRSRWEIETCVKNDQLVQNCVNESTIFFKKEDILDYWKHYRDVKCEEVKILMSKKLLDEVDALISSINAQKEINIDKSDVVINLLKCLEENTNDLILCINVNKIFTKASKND